MATIATFNFAPRRLYQPGDVNLPASNIPAGANWVSIDIDRTEWLDPAIKVAGSFDISFDGGATWIPGLLGFTAEGGPLLSPTPVNPNPNHTIASADIPQASNPNRKVRGKLTITGGAVRITASALLTQ